MADYDPTGTFLGNMLGLDPQAAQQFQGARNQMGDMGMAQGMLQNSGFHFPGGVTLAPGAAGLMGMMQGQAAVPQQALQTAQAGNAVAEGLLNRLRGQEILAKLPLYQQAARESMGSPGVGTTQPGTGQPMPTNPAGQFASPIHPIQNAIWATESGGKVDGVPNGSSGEIGPMQIMPGTGKMFGASIDDLRDNNRNLQIGGSIIANYAQKYNGDPTAIAIAYNAGPGAADKYVASGGDLSVIPKSTRDVYLPKFQDNLAQYAQAAPTQGTPGGPSPMMAGNPAPPGAPSAMPTPPGISQAEVDNANARIRRNGLLGIPINPQDQAIVTYGLDISKAGATTGAQEKAKIDINPDMVDVTINGVDMKVPKPTAIELAKQYAPKLGPQSQPQQQPIMLPQVPTNNLGPVGGPSGSSMPPTQPMPGSSIMPGGAATRSMLPPQPPQMAQNGPGGMAGGSTPPTPSMAPSGSGTTPGTPPYGKLALTPGQQKEAEMAGAGYAEEYNGKDNANSVVSRYTNAQTAMPNLYTLERALTNFETGPTAEAKLAAAKYAVDLARTFFGAKPTQELQDWIASGEVITKSSTKLGFELARSLGSRESQMVVQQAMSANPNLLNSTQGNQMLTQLIKQGLNRDIDRRAFVDNYKVQKGTYDGAVTAFDKARPTEYYMSQIPGFEVPVKSPADAKNLAPGTMFRTPKGDVFQVPNG